MTTQEKLIFKFLITTFIVGLMIGWVRNKIFIKEIEAFEGDEKFAEELSTLALSEKSEDSQAIKMSEISTLREEDKVSSEIVLQKVNLNLATKQQLMTLPGIGPAIAERIIIHREDYGKFESLEELTLIKGIGEKTIEKFRDLIKL